MADYSSKTNDSEFCHFEEDSEDGCDSLTLSKHYSRTEFAIYVENQTQSDDKESVHYTDAVYVFSDEQWAKFRQWVIDNA